MRANRKEIIGYDFAGAPGEVEHQLRTGSKPVMVADFDTVRPGEGSLVGIGSLIRDQDLADVAQPLLVVSIADEQATVWGQGKLEIVRCV